MLKFKINKEFTIEYRAKGDAAGITDLTGTITKPDGTSDSLTFTEIGNGLYKATYTPTLAGLHRIEITSDSNGDKYINNFMVVEVDLDDISSKLDTNATKLDAIQSDVTDIKDTQSTHTTKLDNISSKLDDIDNQIYPGGEILGW